MFEPAAGSGHRMLNLHKILIILLRPSVSILAPYGRYSGSRFCMHWTKNCGRSSVPVFWLALGLGLLSAPAHGEVRLVGTARLDGKGTDLSGLTEILEGGIPHNRMGGISAIEYTGKDDHY